jgi:hypothetical protein
MTIMNERHERIVFPRTTLHEFWNTLQDHFAHTDPQQWKRLAMLALRENSGWTVEQIGRAFGHPRGHVSRLLQLTKQQIRSRFDVPHGVLSPDDGFSDPDDAAAVDDRDPPWMIDPSFIASDDTSTQTSEVF